MRRDLAMIPLSDPGRSMENVRVEIESAFRRVLTSGRFVLGEENEALSEELSAFLSGVDTVLVGNGTDALEIALVASGATRGSSVVTVANAGGYSSTAIRQIGGIPIYVDVDPNSLQMSVDSLRKVLSHLDEPPTALVVTHLYGYAAPIAEICVLAKRHGITVIEDCAQSFGASVGHQRLGTFGDMATTSFYPTKNLACLGDGGAIFTSSPALAERARALRQYGWTSKYRVTVEGGRNSRMDDLQAAVVRIRLPFLDSYNSARRKIHGLYRSIPSPFGVFPHSTGDHFAAHLAVIVTHNRQQLVSHLRDRGIANDVHYPIPDHAQPAHRSTAIAELPVTESMAERVLSVPLFPEMREDEVAQVMEALGG